METRVERLRGRKGEESLDHWRPCLYEQELEKDWG